MATSGLDIDLLVLLAFESGNHGCAPRVDLAIDEDHFRIVVFQEVIDLMVQSRTEVYFIDQLPGKHDTVQVSVGTIDRKVFLERFYVIAIITELTGGLYEERDIRLVLGEVIRTADFHQMIEERLIVGRLGRDRTYRSSPLPKSE